VSHLLDTNACIDHLRHGSASRVTMRLLASPSGSVYTCSVVLAELYYGALHSPSTHRAANLSLVDRVQRQFVALPFDTAAAEIYGQVRADLAAAGTLIGPYDMQIASIAIAHRLTLVTRNTAEFSRVAGLAIEDWQ
jgi:tRNA(fMet)-specific endonuclease VapC